MTWITVVPKHDTEVKSQGNIWEDRFVFKSFYCEKGRDLLDCSQIKSSNGIVLQQWYMNAHIYHLFSQFCVTGTLVDLLYTLSLILTKLKTTDFFLSKLCPTWGLNLWLQDEELHALQSESARHPTNHRFLTQIYR